MSIYYTEFKVIIKTMRSITPKKDNNCEKTNLLGYEKLSIAKVVSLDIQSMHLCKPGNFIYFI